MKRITLMVLAALALTLSIQADPDIQVSGKKVRIDFDGKAANGPRGIGLFLGQPTGLTFEMDLSRDSWLDFKAAWNLAGGNGGFDILLQGNYEYAFPGMVTIDRFSLTPFFGAGAVVSVNDAGVGIGVRVPGGISWRFESIPLELFLEAGIDVYLFPAFDIGGSGGLGVRYRF